ncbi:unnamed protein product [Nezara viridula]|uniref:Uncharacterized protein n=1 Tax=Nezara viridula TaxID=85310 RepID=A0A9P0MUU9_NEZVI|nr:unnamed protein product [Nezara viridula]
MILFLIAGFGLAAGQNLQLDEEDPCHTLDGGQGVCTLRSRCNTLGELELNRPPFCGFKRFEPIVCCPTNLKTTTSQGKKVEQFCRLLNQGFSNINNVRKVLGGNESAPRTHTYMVLIGFGKREKINWSCAGSLITARYVLSAAHCSDPPEIGPAKWARLGELDHNSTSDDAKPVDMTIVERIRHPKYIPRQKYNDIALFKLDSDVVYNNYILPICLHTKRQITTKIATVIGWGRTGYYDDYSNKLLEAAIEVYNDTECKRLMFSKITPEIRYGHEADQMICAGVPDGSKDACQGDSGGPLVVLEKGMRIRTQLGITSFGRKCGSPNSPGVYTRVSNYISWIEEVAFGDFVIS